VEVTKGAAITAVDEEPESDDARSADAPEASNLPMNARFRRPG
jgi:hypothetical protein